MASVASLKLAVLARQLLGFEHSLRTSAQKLGAVCAEVGSQRIEEFNQVVVELYEYFAASHDHMVVHMVGNAYCSVASIRQPAQNGTYGCNRFPAFPTCTAGVWGRSLAVGASSCRLVWAGSSTEVY